MTCVGQLGSNWLTLCVTQVSYNSEVIRGEQQTDGSWELHTPSGVIRAKIVVNAAGLYGDRVEDICQPSSFR